VTLGYRWPMGNESTVIIPIPEVEPIVGPLRLQYDGAAHLGVPAHVTLLYPFCPLCPPSAVVVEIKTLRDVCVSVEAFPFSFTEVRRLAGNVLFYLHHKSETFAQSARTLVNIWPPCKPYN
jgi:hypothetical protein